MSLVGPSKPKQRTNIIRRKAQLARSFDERQQAHMCRTIGAATANCPWRLRQYVDPLIVTDRFSVYAGQPRHLTDHYVIGPRSHAHSKKPCFCSRYRMHPVAGCCRGLTSATQEAAATSNWPGVPCTMSSTAECALFVIESPTCRGQECRRNGSDAQIATNQSGWRRSGLPNRLKSVASARNATTPRARRGSSKPRRDRRPSLHWTQAA